MDKEGKEEESDGGGGGGGRGGGETALSASIEEQEGPDTTETSGPGRFVLPKILSHSL